MEGFGNRSIADTIRPYRRYFHSRRQLFTQRPDFRPMYSGIFAVFVAVSITWALKHPPNGRTRLSMSSFGHKRRDGAQLKGHSPVDGVYV
jgi:hypothetical protein